MIKVILSLISSSILSATRKLVSSLRAIMKRATYFLVFLFYFQTGCFGNPVPEPEAAFSTLRVFRYHGEINATNSADNETISRWTVSGKLSVYNGERKTVFKLDDVKTSVFNGLRRELDYVQEKEIPEEAKVVLQPFEVKRHDVENISIDFLPNEPLWSQNFKRGLASNLDIEVEMKHLREAEKNPGASFKETTLYGHCDVHYKASNDSAITYERSFSHASCENSPKKTRSNIPRFSSAYVKDYDSGTIKTTTLLDRNGTMMPHHMVSETHLEAKSLLATAYSQYIDQITTLDLLDFNESETKIPIDTSKMTDQRELIYEVGDEPTSGRHSYNTSVADLTIQYLHNYDKFEKYFLHSPIEHIDISKHDAVENMYLALQGLDVDGLKTLEQTMYGMKDNNDILNMYFTLLPYVGTHATVKYLVSYITQEDKRRTNEILLLNIMAVLPNFIENYSDELLEELEPLMDLNSKYFRLKTVRNAGSLSFAAAIGHPNKSGNLWKRGNDKYSKLYHQKYLESETYEDRMIYLLGLINMYNSFDLHLMNQIITNTTESKHIRTLALAGFKHQLQYSDITELFDIYWPIVQNKQEPFDLRVGALDLLLFVHLSEEQFITIINKYSLHSSDPQDKHLANYILTSLHSLQNTTFFKDYLGSMASEALKTTQIPSMGTFSTGNYRLAHTGNDMGAYLQARVISDPSTNIINSIQLTYKSYGFSSELNGYTLYLNIDGLFEAEYAHQFLRRLRWTSDVTSVSELLAALKENHFELESIFKNKDCHIDIVVFKDNTAVYATHIDWFDKWQMMFYLEELHLLLRISLSVQFPLINYMQMPSDLGTPLQFSNGVEDITYLNVISVRNYFKYRSTWNYQSWIESYNPFVDTNIATYKYTGIDRAIDFKYSYMSKDYMFSWLNKNDSFVMYTDNIMGTSVEDENILMQYCEKCESYINVSPHYFTMDRIRKIEPFGFKVNMTGEGTSVESCIPSFPNNIIDYYVTNEDYKSNIDAFPKAGPIMFLTHVYNHKILFDDDFSTVSYRSIPLFDEDAETIIKMYLNPSFAPRSFNPIDKKTLNFTFEIQHKILNHTEISSSFKADYRLVLDPEYTDDTGKKHYGYFMTLNLKYNAAPDDYSNTSFKVCAKRELFFPSLRSDKYSLDPVEPATGKFVWEFTKNLTGEDGTCTSSGVTTFTDIYSATDKAEKLKNKQNKKDYDECMENSKNLHFTAPTNACRRISARLAEYDNYMIQRTLLVEEIYEGEEDIEIRSKSYNESMFEYSRDGNDYMKLVLNKGFTISLSPYKTIYNPVTVNPLAMAYVNSISIPPFIATSKCTIAPSAIEQFSGKYTPNQNKEWLAFAVCYNITRTGLIGHTIDKHHIGFSYWSDEHVFTATVKEGKLHVEINGKELHKYFASEASEYKVNFLGDNVINILDEKVNIYYNTEYLQVTVNALYSKLLCGVCTQDQ